MALRNRFSVRNLVVSDVHERCCQVSWAIFFISNSCLIVNLSDHQSYHRGAHTGVNPRETKGVSPSPGGLLRLIFLTQYKTNDFG